MGNIIANENKFKNYECKNGLVSKFVFVVPFPKKINSRMNGKLIYDN